MAQFEKNVFTFTWRIENFSMCPQQVNEWIKSPIFVVDFLPGLEWNLLLYPRGGSEPKHVSCFLERSVSSSFKGNVTISYTLIGLSINSDKNIEREVLKRTFGTGESFGYREFSSHEYIFNYENGLLQNDTLTIQCHVHREKDAIPGILETSFWNSKRLSYRKKCSARLRIKVSSKSMVWPIKRFTALQPNVKLRIAVESSLKDEPSLQMTFWLKDESEVDQHAHIQIHNVTKPNVFVRAKIKITGIPKCLKYQREDEHFFQDGSEIWDFPPFIKIKDLMEKEYLSYTHGALYLHCHFSFSSKGNESFIETTSSVIPVHDEDKEKLYTLTTNYRNLYKDGKFSDVTLCVKERLFKAHKNILGSKSDVFSAMFESDMQEKEKGFVDITDLEPDTVDHLLCFLYTDILEDMSLENVLKLYSAADKYNVVPLKCQCCSMLVSSLSVSSVCDVLVTADAHQDEDLLDGIRDFIHANASQIFASQQWKAFTESHVHLAANTMLHELTNKFWA